MATILGNLATLSYNLVATGSYTQITSIKSITSPHPKGAVTDVSSITDVTNVKLPGFLDNGAFSVEVYHTTANKALISTLIQLVVYYELGLVDSSQFAFQAIMNDWNFKIARNGEVVYTFSFEITGAITIT